MASAGSTFPSLARLSFWVPLVQAGGFRLPIGRRLLPFLRKRGLMEAAVPGRPVAAGVFSRLFGFQTAAELTRQVRSLRDDPDWQEKVAQADPSLRWKFGPDRTRAGPGRIRNAGAGFRHGLWHTLGVQDGLPAPVITAVMQDRRGRLWLGTQGGGLACYDGARIAVFTTEDGLADDHVLAIAEDRAGHLWIGTGAWVGEARAGVSRYDGQEFVTFGAEDGLANNQVPAILEDRDGCLWIGTWSGLSRYDGNQFRNFTVEDGLAGSGLRCLLEDRDGCLWFATWGGLNRYDGREVTGFAPEVEQGGLNVRSMLEDRQGRLWFGGSVGGACYYDGEQFFYPSPESGPPPPAFVTDIEEDAQGNLWAGIGDIGSGMGEGVARYDGKTFAFFTSRDGLGRGMVMAILRDRRGFLWFATLGGGVSRYDGRGFTTFTQADGLALDWVTCILEDREGRLWFGTFGSGVCVYDGQVFQVLCRRDGLAHDAVQHIVQDRRGDLWIATEGGVTRYRPGRTPPAVQRQPARGSAGERPRRAVAEVGVSRPRFSSAFPGRLRCGGRGRRPASPAYSAPLEGFSVMSDGASPGTVNLARTSARRH